MSKTKKNFKNNKGGKAIASGGYGCVFNPALICEGSTKREKNKISKLMTDKHAMQEYEEINVIKEKLDSVPNYQDYFLIYDVTICRPANLNRNDLSAFEDKCSALPKDNITKSNINDKLDEVMSLNIPNGGLAVDDYIFKYGSFEFIYTLHEKLVKLLKHGIMQMNKRNIYHCDIKDSNILVDDSNDTIKTRLIDWGLAVNYIPNDDEKFPRQWRDRPLQYNVPFSVIIFNNSFVEKYTEYLKNGGKINEESLKPFVIDYLNYWMKERGAGHYKFINEIIYKLYSNDLTSISEKNKPVYIETQITFPLIVDYLVEVLVHYTKFKENGELNLREYLNKVFIKIIDIYGFINVYYPILEVLTDNYFSLNSEQLEILNHIKFMFQHYLYTPRYESYDMHELFASLKELGNLMHISIYGKKKTSAKSSSLASGTKPLASGIKTRKKIKSKSLLFKRKPFVKRFKNPLFLSLK